MVYIASIVDIIKHSIFVGYNSTHNKTCLGEPSLYGFFYRSVYYKIIYYRGC
jgi:hypothetical protein